MQTNRCFSYLNLALFSMILSLVTACKTNDPNLNNASNAVTVTDKDGNVYHTVTIGTQTWMVENLKTTHYLNGDAIANITDNTAWGRFSNGAWCDYSNLVANGTKYGHLYNWYAVTDTRKIAPEGWHVPTDAEWTTLCTYLGGEIVAGGKLKEAGTLNWPNPNISATNETGFTALPGGYRVGDLGFSGQFGFAGWWSSSNSISSVELLNLYGGMNKGVTERTYGYSVRCLKN